MKTLSIYCTCSQNPMPSALVSAVCCSGMLLPWQKARAQSCFQYWPIRTPKHSIRAWGHARFQWPHRIHRRPLAATAGIRSLSSLRRARLRQKAGKPERTFHVPQPIKFLRPESPLEGDDGILCGPFHIRRKAITVLAQRILRRGLYARLRPKPDAVFGKRLPRKQLARIFLARGCHIGMADDARGRDGVAGDDLLRDVDEGGDLFVRKRNISEFMARIDEFDADGARIDVARTRPIGNARMPGAPVLRHMAIDAPVAAD